MPTLPSRRPVWDTVSAPHRMALGLRALRADETWLDLDRDFESDLQVKSSLLREHREQVFVETPGSRPAQREALCLVVSTLARVHPDLFTLQDDRFRVEPTAEVHALDAGTRPPLETAARCVQEDLVVMEKGPSGWCLTAGAVCFPTRWDLPSKLGQPMAVIHERVPGYRAELDAPANRFFDGTKTGVVYQRGNWSLMDDPSLFQPEGKLRDDANAHLDASNAGEKVWLRVEHQTLQRLPETDAILFGIRVHRTRLDRVAKEPDVARVLIEAIETMPIEMQHYKSLGVVRGATAAFLGQAIEAAPISSTRR